MNFQLICGIKRNVSDWLPDIPSFLTEFQRFFRIFLFFEQKTKPNALCLAPHCGFQAAWISWSSLIPRSLESSHHLSKISCRWERIFNFRSLKLAPLGQGSLENQSKIEQLVRMSSQLQRAFLILLKVAKNQNFNEAWVIGGWRQD